MTLTGEQAVLASRIKTIDRDLDDLEHRTIEMVEVGIRGGSAGGVLQIAEDEVDEKKARLLAERADLAQQLKTSVENSSTTLSHGNAVPSPS